MSARYIAAGAERARQTVNPDDAWPDHWQADYATYIIDTHENRVVGHDMCEPEDATLDRHFSWILEELNRA